MEQIFFIICLLFVGYFLKFLEFPKNFAQSLNLFVIYVSLPATVLLQVPKIHFENSFLLPALIPYLVLLLSVMAVKIFFQNESQNTKAALYLLLPLGNTSFFGFPMLGALVGEESLKYGIIYDLFGSFTILTIYGAFVIAYFSGDLIDIKSFAKKIVFFPPFLALFVSLLFGEMPQISVPFVEILSQTLVPLAIISVGFTLQLKLADDRIVFYKALFLKLLILPSIVFAFLHSLDFENIIVLTTLLESAMPPMITAGALAINAGFAPRLSAALVGYGIMVAMITLPIYQYLFLHIA